MSAADETSGVRISQFDATLRAHARAVERLLSLQYEDGHWEGENIWNNTILSQYIIVCRIVGRELSPQMRAEMVRHYRVTVSPEGGWNIHPASDASLYCTVLAYIALRVLGLRSDDALCLRAARWVHGQPSGVRALPTWGKFWLSILGLYDYRMVNPMPPEVFLLPHWLPIHPDRLRCHTRSVYQAMAYLYGSRYLSEIGQLREELRQELWKDARPGRRDRTLLGADAHVRPGFVARVAFTMMAAYERRPAKGMRVRALERCQARVAHEQAVTGDVGLSSAVALLNALVLHAAAPGSPAVERSLAAVDYWRWTDPTSGTRYVGTRSQTWDTSFALEALLSHPPTTIGTVSAVDRASEYLCGAQITQDIGNPAVTARDPIAGGWCFSDAAHRWPASDCTAEAVAVLLHAKQHTMRTRIPDETLLRQAVGLLLRMQNSDGGFGSFEARRGARFLEALNPSDMFFKCMVEHSYVECTGSALASFARLREAGIVHEKAERAARRAVRFLLRQQHEDGSWSAAWGVNRIYATFFAVRGLRLIGLPSDHLRLLRAARWLESVQRSDGGWGEHHRGVTEDRYVELVSSQPVMTAWALLAMMELDKFDTSSVDSGIRWLRENQRPHGSWHQEAVTGAFFGTAMLDYRRYPDYFPLWALGRYLAARVSIS